MSQRLGSDEDVVAQSLYFEQEISNYRHLVTELASRAGLDRVPALALDEWTISSNLRP